VLVFFFMFSEFGGFWFCSAGFCSCWRCFWLMSVLIGFGQFCSLTCFSGGVAGTGSF
jgi:hypothetical protein